ncbi:MAG TPA: zf-HC2 domain-containing protein [Thermoanaerobaculia bacterium]
MTCKQLIDCIADYLDGALDHSSRRDFERHLERCGSCAAYLATYRTTIRVVRVICSF